MGLLSVSKGGFFNVVQKNENDDGPVVREIYLFETYITGTGRLKNKTVLFKVTAGDIVSFQCEGDRKDKRAVSVWNNDGEHLGYIPVDDNPVFLRLMNSRKELTGKVSGVDPRKGLKKINIEVYLVDVMD